MSLDKSVGRDQAGVEVDELTDSLWSECGSSLLQLGSHLANAVVEEEAVAIGSESHEERDGED